MYEVVIISSQVPKKKPTNAGEKLVYELCQILLDAEISTIAFAPEPVNGRADEYAVEHRFFDISRNKKFDKIRSLYKDWFPDIAFLNSIRKDKDSVEIIRQAKIIDLQWSANVGFSRWVRVINSHARIVGTFHDVNSQRYFRRSFYDRRVHKKILWRVLERLAGWSDRIMGASVDLPIVLSSKDAALLNLSQKLKKQVEVVNPPVFVDSYSRREEADPYHLVFIGTMYRWENHEAVEWFITEVLPKVWEIEPKFRFTVVGESPASTLTSLSNDSRISFLGFVDNIEDIYDDAGIIVAPIRLGSGVKFKTLEAILHGVPVVSTTAGIEGVANVNWASKIANSAEAFAQSIISVSLDYALYVQKAECSMNESKEVYSNQKYQGRIKKIYNLEI